MRFISHLGEKKRRPIQTGMNTELEMGQFSVSFCSSTTAPVLAYGVVWKYGGTVMLSRINKFVKSKKFVFLH